MDQYSASEIDLDLESFNFCFNDQISDVDKENFFSNENDISIFPNEKPLYSDDQKIRRKSILKSLDPLNPFSSPVVSDHHSQQPLEADENEQILDNIASTEKLDQSWDFMIINDDNKLQDQTTTGDDGLECRPSILDSLQDEFLLYSNINRQSHNTNANDSELLELSINDLSENNVAVDNLLSISPMKKYVEQTVYDRLKKHHQKKEEEWKNIEKMYLNQIEQLKLENEMKDNLLKENEIELKENEKNKKTSLDEKNLVTSELKEFKLQYDAKLVEVEQLKAEIETLSKEVINIASSAMDFEFVAEQYVDTYYELIQQIDTLKKENDDTSSMLHNYLSKLESSKTVVSSLKKNEETLLGEISANKDKMKQLEREIQVNEEELTFHRHCFERQLKKNEIKISMLENGENNLRAELELRIKERDQLKENLTKLLEQN